MMLLSIPPLSTATLAAILGLWIAFAAVGQYSHNYRRLDFMEGRIGMYAITSVLSSAFHIGFSIYLAFSSAWWMPVAMCPVALLAGGIAVGVADDVVLYLGGPKFMALVNTLLGAPALLWKAVIAIAMIAIVHSSPTPAETLSFLTAS